MTAEKETPGSKNKLKTNKEGNIKLGGCVFYLTEPKSPRTDQMLVYISKEFPKLSLLQDNEQFIGFLLYEEHGTAHYRLCDDKDTPKKLFKRIIREQLDTAQDDVDEALEALFKAYITKGGMQAILRVIR